MDIVTGSPPPDAVATLTVEDEWTAFRTINAQRAEANAQLRRTALAVVDPETSERRYGYVLKLDGYEDLTLAPDANVAFGERFILVRYTAGLDDACAVVEAFRWLIRGPTAPRRRSEETMRKLVRKLYAPRARWWTATIAGACAAIALVDALVDAANLFALGAALWLQREAARDLTRAEGDHDRA